MAGRMYGRAGDPGVSGGDRSGTPEASEMMSQGMRAERWSGSKAME